ncbi:MAG: Ycf66 family protein [Synechococcus sp.]
MVNASLNWASIVGIVLAVGGAFLYFMRSFKPALARDYDVFFAAIGLLCGGILFFQGWRLDPILQFGQFLLASTTVFFAYESVRLRGVSTEQARRSAYFDDEPAPSGGLNGGWDSSYDRFDNPEAPPLRRRFQGSADDGYGQRGGNDLEQDFYRPRRPSRAAIPEQAASRRRPREEGSDNWEEPSSERERRMARFGQRDEASDNRSSFGERRSQRQEQRRGSRPQATRMSGADQEQRTERLPSSPSSRPTGVPQGVPLRQAPEDAAFRPSDRDRRPDAGSSAASPSRQARPQSNPRSSRADSGSAPSSRSTPRSSRPRDNSSRFDD